MPFLADYEILIQDVKEVNINILGHSTIRPCAKKVCIP